MSSTMSAPASTSSPPPSQTSAAGGGGGGGGGGGAQNSPLLFFVALGFGVVFTNLWIIVGVKYCFRYNARNRARAQDENGEPIDLANMPQHRRRRREKKLMTIDEVNERFPITKYKTWVTTRAEQGLPTEGGVSQSRAVSVRDAEGTIEPIVDSSKSVVTANVSATDAHDPVPTTPTTSKTPNEINTPEKATEAVAEAPRTEQPKENAKAENAAVEGATGLNTRAPAAAVASTTTLSHSENDDEEDAIPAAVPGAAEMLEAPGDSCAICIDVLEEEEDVRGLSCGHAFHALCIDPWLTNRRACCPLCKADYYVPKPRPDQPEGQNPLGQQQPEDGTAPTTTFDGMDHVRRPSIAATLPVGAISRYVPRLTGRGDGLPQERRNRERSQTMPSPNIRRVSEAPQGSGSLGERFISMFRRNHDNEAIVPSSGPMTREHIRQQQREQEQRQQQQQQRPEQSAESRRWRPSLPSWRRRRDDQVAENEPTTPRQLEAGSSPATNV